MYNTYRLAASQPRPIHWSSWLNAIHGFRLFIHDMPKYFHIEMSSYKCEQLNTELNLARSSFRQAAGHTIAPVSHTLETFRKKVKWS